MRKYIIIIYLIFVCNIIQAQIKPDIINSMGNSTQLTNGYITYSIGDPFVGAFSVSNKIISQGFLQSWLTHNKNLKLILLLEGLYKDTGIMNQAKDYNIKDDSFYPKFTNQIVDTISVIIRSTNPPNYSILAEYHSLNLNTDGSVTDISVPARIISSNYIVINHRNSVETWSDSVDFSDTLINYNFFTHHVSTEFPDNMYKLYSNGVHIGNFIYSGDLTQDGVINIFDLADIFDFINDPTSVSGYKLEDVNGDGVINIYDLVLVYDNIILGITSVNPFMMKKK